MKLFVLLLSTTAFVLARPSGSEKDSEVETVEIEKQRVIELQPYSKQLPNADEEKENERKTKEILAKIEQVNKNLGYVKEKPRPFKNYFSSFFSRSEPKTEKPLSTEELSESLKDLARVVVANGDRSKSERNFAEITRRNGKLSSLDSRLELDSLFPFPIQVSPPTERSIENQDDQNRINNSTFEDQELRRTITQIKDIVNNVQNNYQPFFIPSRRITFLEHHSDYNKLRNFQPTRKTVHPNSPMVIIPVNEKGEKITSIVNNEEKRSISERRDFEKSYFSSDEEYEYDGDDEEEDDSDNDSEEILSKKSNEQSTTKAPEKEVPVVPKKKHRRPYQPELEIEQLSISDEKRNFEDSRDFRKRIKPLEEATKFFNNFKPPNNIAVHLPTKEQVPNDEMSSKDTSILGGGNKKKYMSKDNTGSGVFIQRLKVRKGGVAIAGPGGIATAGSGGTAIVGPSGVALTQPDSVAIAGAGSKVVAVNPNINLTELVNALSNMNRTKSQDDFVPRVGKVVAIGPVVYYNRG